MPFLFLLSLISLPLIEIAVFIMVGEWIGVLPTIGLIILSAIVGLSIVRRQGLSLLTQTQTDLRQRKAPAQSISHGFFLVVAGILLAIPGFLTDIIAFLLLIPPIRSWITHLIIGYVQRSPHVSVHMSGANMGMRPDPFGETEATRNGPIIDGEIVEDLTPTGENPHDRRGNNISPWRQ